MEEQFEKPGGLGFPAQERCEPVTVNPKEGYKVCQRAGAPLL